MDKEHRQMMEILSEIESERIVQEMKQYTQHGKISTYENCKNVAKLSYRIDRRLFLHSDLRVLLTGAMLHDFYLYDWHSEDEGMHNLHGFTHAETACINAQKYFNIDTKTSQVIYCHMWPLNPRRVPKSKEGWIVCFADKCISLYETLFMR